MMKQDNLNEERLKLRDKLKDTLADSMRRELQMRYELFHLQQDIDAIKFEIEELEKSLTYEKNSYDTYQEMIFDALLSHDIEVSDDEMTVTGDLFVEKSFLKRIPEFAPYTELGLSSTFDDNIVHLLCTLNFSDTDMLQNAEISLAVEDDLLCIDLAMSPKEIETIARNVAERIGIDKENNQKQVSGKSKATYEEELPF